MKYTGVFHSFLRTANNNLRPILSSILVGLLMVDSAGMAAHGVDPADVGLTITTPRQLPQLSTKAEQLAALEEVLSVLKYQYAGLEYKQENFGLSLDQIRTKYSRLINEAVTVDEASGFSPRVKRSLLSPIDARYLMTAVISELHDGHTRALAPTQDATTVGIHTAAIDGRLYVTGFKPRFMVTVYEDRPLSILDEVIAIDGKPLEEYIRRNLQYVNNGTIEARKDEALERILEVPHKLLPPLRNGKTVKVTFRRDGQEFTNEYLWQNVDEIDLTRPANPTDAVRKGDRFERDSGDFVFGEKGAVRSYFFEGMMNKASLLEKQGTPMRVDNIGEMLNKARYLRKLNVISAYLVQEAGKLEQANPKSKAGATPSPAPGSPATPKKHLKAIADAAAPVGPQPQKAPEISDEALQGMIERLAPVERLEAYVIRREAGKSIGVIRLPSYMPSENGVSEVFNELSWMTQALQLFQDDPDVGLILIDQLSNPGGYVIYGEMLLSLFASTNSPLRAQNAQFVLSEKLFQTYLLDQPITSNGENLVSKRKAFLLSLRRQMDNQQRISGQMPFSMDSVFGRGGDPSLIENHGFSTDKKVAFLVDGRSASCGEFVPGVLQDNARATIVGEKSMGLGHPLNGHVKDLTLTEMDFRCPFASSTRASGDSIENIGIVPNLARRVLIRDLKDHFVQYFDDVVLALSEVADGKNLSDVQAKLDQSESRTGGTGAKKADAIVVEIKALTEDMQKEITALPPEIESSSAQWTKAYQVFFAKVSAKIGAAQISEGQATLIDVPLPKELLKDKILANSWRKDVVLRRLEEMKSKPDFSNRPQTQAFIDQLRTMALSSKVRFSFNLSCRALLGK